MRKAWLANGKLYKCKQLSSSYWVQFSVCCAAVVPCLLRGWGVRPLMWNRKWGDQVGNKDGVCGKDRWSLRLFRERIWAGGRLDVGMRHKGKIAVNVWWVRGLWWSGSLRGKPLCLGWKGKSSPSFLTDPWLLLSLPLCQGSGPFTQSQLAVRMDLSSNVTGMGLSGLSEKFWHMHCQNPHTRGGPLQDVPILAF